jgi:hypothetical protein
MFFCRVNCFKLSRPLFHNSFKLLLAGKGLFAAAHGENAFFALASVPCLLLLLLMLQLSALSSSGGNTHNNTARAFSLMIEILLLYIYRGPKAANILHAHALLTP